LTAISMKDFTVKLVTEYSKMKKRWEDGGLYYHVRTYIDKYTPAIRLIHWGKMKLYISAILASSRLGLPILTSSIAYLTGLKPRQVAEHLCYLASLKILSPMDKPEKGIFRRYKLTKEFIRYLYSKRTIK